MLSCPILECFSMSVQSVDFPFLALLGISLATESSLYKEQRKFRYVDLEWSQLFQVMARIPGGLDRSKNESDNQLQIFTST